MKSGHRKRWRNWQGSLKKKKQEIAERLSAMQKELIRSSMRHRVFLGLEIEQLDQLISRRIRDAQQQKQDELLQTVPGIKPEAAANVLAEVGADMK